jgi:hypothetical protein
MAALPRPKAARTSLDLEGLLHAAQAQLTHAHTARDFEAVLWRTLFDAYQAGVEAQRELAQELITSNSPDDRPAPLVPPAVLSALASDLSRLLRVYHDEGAGETE